MARLHRRILLASLALLTLQQFGHAAAPETTPAAIDLRLPAAGSVRGIWVWQAVYIADDAEQDRMLAFFKKQGLNRMLLQVPWVKGSMAAGAPQIDLQSQLGKLLDKAAAQGVAVEALDGSPAMARKPHWATTAKSVDAILAFNKSRPSGAKFVGLHWDVEPYVMKEWKTPERADIMLEYLECLEQTKKTLTAADPAMLLAVDIPMWYDVANEPGNSCRLTYHGVEKSLDQHTLDVCDYIGIMSYRRHATGPNSVVDMISGEIAYAEKIGKRVCPSLETVPLADTPQITFYGAKPQDLLDTRDAVVAALKDRPGFQGVLVHCYPTVRNLIEGTPDATP